MTFAEQVKSQVDIVRTVREYVQPLRRVGPRWVGLCPFHTEKTPSFGVTPALGIYKCFGCGAAGDVIRFVQEIDGLTFWEALTSLAERNGIPLPQRPERPDADTELRAALFEMYELAARTYAENLYSASASEVRDYLAKRGLSQSTAQQFLLGYSEPGWETLAKRFGQKYTQAQMDASGLFGRRDNGTFFDKFRGRLMFPIHNEQGKVIGFGARALRDGDEPKYLNSPETPIYRKSSVLYNLHRAKDAIRRGNRVVLVEGYMDVIGVFAAGVHNVVASCGTALTSQQVRSMKRHTQSIVVNFDPDNAGASATERSLQILLEEGLHVRVLELEANLDPDEFIRKHGSDSYGVRLDRASSYFIWLADRARAKYGTASAEARMAGYEELMLPAIRRLSDKLERATVANEVADYLGLDRSIVLAELQKGASKNSRRSQPAAPVVPVRERELIYSLVLAPEIREILLPRLQASPAARAFAVWPVVEVISAVHQSGEPFSYELLEAKLSESQRHLLSASFFTDSSHDVYTNGQAGEFLTWLDGEDVAAHLRGVTDRMREAERSGNLEEAMRQMAIADDLKKRLRRPASV